MLSTVDTAKACILYILDTVTIIYIFLYNKYALN